MQRGRFAREFVAELLREPRALRMALLAERERWLRGSKVGGREELLFELEMWLRTLERMFERRPADGTALGQDYGEEVRVVRDVLRRAALIARRLTSADTERGFRLRAYVERQLVEDARAPRLLRDLVDQRSPEESLWLLCHQLRSLQGLADQLLRLPYVTFSAWSDYAALAEQALLASRYFRPPSALEFRAEYDRVGSVRLLELVKRVSESRARKALALGFLACFRVLRYLRHVPPAPVPVPRRAPALLLAAREEAAAVAHYLSTDLPRLAAAAPEAQLVAGAAVRAAARLNEAAAEAGRVLLQARPVERPAVDTAREVLSEGAKAATAELARAVEPHSSAAEIFDGQRARRDRTEKLRRDLRLLLQLLKDALEDLFPVLRGETPVTYRSLSTLQRFAEEFRHGGYHLLRASDVEPFDRFFSVLDALHESMPSASRDRHLYLDLRRFVVVVERDLALVARRAEILGVEFDQATFDAELARVRAAPPESAWPGEEALGTRLLSPPGADDDEFDQLEPEIEAGLLAAAADPESLLEPQPVSLAPGTEPEPDAAPPAALAQPLPPAETPAAAPVAPSAMQPTAPVEPEAKGSTDTKLRPVRPAPAPSEPVPEHELTRRFVRS